MSCVKVSLDTFSSLLGINISIPEMRDFCVCSCAQIKGSSRCKCELQECVVSGNWRFWVRSVRRGLKVSRVALKCLGRRTSIRLHQVPHSRSLSKLRLQIPDSIINISTNHILIEWQHGALIIRTWGIDFDLEADV